MHSESCCPEEESGEELLEGTWHELCTKLNVVSTSQLQLLKKECDASINDGCYTRDPEDPNNNLKVKNATHV